MVFGLFKRKDPVCGMKEEKGKGIVKDGNWFCSDNCVKQYSKAIKESSEFKGCCH